MTGGTEAMTEPALRLRGVGVSFRGVRALDDVSFDVPAGGVTAVIGPNGAGKTTLFNCIGGIYRHEGDIELYGDSVRQLRPSQRANAGIARTFQTPTLRRLSAGSVITSVPPLMRTPPGAAATSRPSECC